MLLEKEHDLAHRPVLLPGGADGGKFAVGNARNLGELVHVLLEHAQGAFAEVADNAMGDLRPHSRDQAGTEVFLERAGARGFQFAGILRLELAAEFRVVHPGADELHGGAGKDPRLMDGNCCQPVVCAQRSHLEHRPAACLVVIGDAFDYTTNFFLNFRLFHVWSGKIEIVFLSDTRNHAILAPPTIQEQETQQESIMEQLQDKVLKVLAQIRPTLQRDGGDVEFAGMDGDSVVKVRLTGACQGCPMSRVTLKEGIEKFVKSEIPTIRAVEAVE